MLSLAIVVLVPVLAEAQVLLGVNNSFDITFYDHFSRIGCDNESEWQLVSYKELDIDPPTPNSDKAIQAVEKSCTSSFPIIFMNGTLEVVVYVQTSSEDFRISIEVFSSHDTPALRYLYGRTTEGYVPGWRTIVLDINSHGERYINLRGRSLKNEIVLIDSFRYTPNPSIIDHEEANHSMLHKEDEEEIIFDFKKLNRHLEKVDIESSGEFDDGSGEKPDLDPLPDTTPEQSFEVTDEPDTYPPELSNSIWNPFTISLVTFGVILVVLIVGVGAYHCGKVRAIDNTTLLFDDTEPPRTITIPRVTGIYDNRLRFMSQN